MIEIVGDIKFICRNSNLTIVSAIISKKFNCKTNVFGGEDEYIFDEIQGVYFDFFGNRYGILQNPENEDMFSFKIFDISNQIIDSEYENATEINVTERAYFLLKDCEEFEIIRKNKNRDNPLS